MPINPTYPGVYIEEIPSSAHTITPAPTSVAVFVGYSHPFRTKPENFGKAVLLFSFTEYERELGGFFASETLSSDLPYAVNDFFINGGSIAYVVGLQANNHFSGPAATEAILPATASLSAAGWSVNFVAREPITNALPMTVSITTGDGGAGTVTLTQGTRVESFRDVTLDSTNASYIKSVLKDSSILASVDTTTGTSFGATPGTVVNTVFADVPFVSTGTFTTTFEPGDFKAAFQANSSLDKVDIFNLLVLPGVSDTSVLSAAIAFAEQKRAILIMDPKPELAADGSDGGPEMKDDTFPMSLNAAIYFPYLKSQSAVTGESISLPPSGYVAGVYARTDTNRGVWKAPAGLEATLLDTSGVVPSGRMTDMRQGVLNQLGINCIRSFPSTGTVVYGARTTVANNTAFAPWKYVPVRRMALFIEQTLFRELKWVVFEPNDEPLWIAIRTSVGSFMLSLFNQGAFQGQKPSQAFVVKCDSSTTTDDDINRGIVNIIVGFRPLKPAEFVFVKIAQLAGQVQA